MPKPEYAADAMPRTEQTQERPDMLPGACQAAPAADAVSAAAGEFASGDAAARASLPVGGAIANAWPPLERSASGGENAGGCAEDGAASDGVAGDDGNGHLRPAAIRAYSRQTRQVRQDELIVQYLPLVHKIVQHIVSYLHPPLGREDLISAGTIGLVKAARDFDPVHQAEFKTYAYIRIRGAVIDELRGWSFAPPQLKRQFDLAQDIVRRAAEHTGAVPSDEELARRLDMSVDKMYRMFENARARHFLSIHALNDESPALAEALTAADDPRPEDGLQRRELLREVTRAIAELPKRQRQIMILYYGKELTMKQIADVLHLTESRISQLHAAALVRLSAKLKTFSETEA